MIHLVHFRSKILKNRRRVFFYLPPGWELRRTPDLPILYMQDGQNLFSHVCHEVPFQWELDRVATHLLANRRIPRVIIVGLANTGSRADEYTPTHCEWAGCGGQADRYLDFITEEVAPFFKAHFPVSPLRTATAIGGSSLGGLLALYAAATRWQDFGLCIASSPSLWWGRFAIFKVLEHARFDPAALRLWVDIGRGEMRRIVAEGQLHRPIRVYRLLDQILRSSGFQPGVNYWYHEQKRGMHDERSWGKRMRRALPFLLGCPKAETSCPVQATPCEKFLSRSCPRL